ncbi:MAG TPA: SBBP repeat-containing protein, partial [Candidatus Paceibacterota bacterium]|nr:SBBP repeat-containing protein [Candidatus Paceibacterota bacterium]
AYSTNFPGVANAITFSNAAGFFTNVTVLDHLNMQTKRTVRADAFVAKFSASGTSLIYGTYLGGTNDDLGEHITVDSTGNAYVTGHTYSRVFPTNAIATPVSTGTNNFNSHVFVTKIGTGLPPSLLYSVQFGSKSTDRATGIAVDEVAQRVYVTGYTTWTNFFATNIYADLRSTNAITRRSSGTPDDGFIAVLQEGPGNTVSFTNCVLFGGRGNDLPNGIAIHPEGANTAVYVAGQTYSSDFVVTNLVNSSLVQTNLGHAKKARFSDAFVGKFLFP